MSYPAWTRIVAGCIGGFAIAAQAAAVPEGAADLAALPLSHLLDVEVSGASKFSQRASETAASVTVITSAEIRAMGWRTLADALASVRGVMVTTDHSYRYLGVRGFFAPGDYNTRVLLLIDGNRVNENIYDQAVIGTEFPLDLELVDRIEFIPGHGSAVYGANALYGVINVITKRPDTAGLTGATLAIGSGQMGSVRLGGSHSLPEGLRVMWSASRMVQQGRDIYAPDQQVDGADGISHGTDFQYRTSLYFGAELGEVRASMVYMDRYDAAPLTLDTVYGDPRNTNRDTYTLLDATWTHPVDARNTLTAHAYAGNYQFDGRYAIDYPPVTVNRDDATGRWWGTELRWFSTALTGHKLLGGVEYQRSPVVHQLNYDIGTTDVYLDDRRSSQRWALYGEDQFELTPTLTLSAGARADHVNEELRFSPRLALNWRLQDDLTAKLIYGRAFRPPNAYEAHYEVEGIGGYKLNPALRDENVRGSELALDWRPTARDRLSASLYRHHIRNVIVQAYDAADQMLQFRNASELRANGLELEAERLWACGMRWRINATFLHATDSGETPLAVYAPPRAGNVAGVIPLGPEWDLGVQGEAAARRGAAPGYGTLGLNLTHGRATQGWSISVGVQDLFDRQPSDPGTDLEAQPEIVRHGRTWRLELSYVLR